MSPGGVVVSASHYHATLTFVITSSILLFFTVGCMAVRLHARLIRALIMSWDDIFLIMGFVSIIIRNHEVCNNHLRD